MYDKACVIPPGQKMQIELEMQYTDLLYKMWLDEMPAAARFKTKYSDDDKTKITKALTFDPGTSIFYVIKKVEFEVHGAKLHYLEYDLAEPLPKQISNVFVAPSIVVHKLSEATRQHINLFFSPDKNATDIIVTFVREADMNRNINDELYNDCKSLPPTLREMTLTKTNGLNAQPNVVSNFDLKDLHINRMNRSWRNYLNYLIDYEYLDQESASHFFKNPEWRVIQPDIASSTEEFPHSSAAYFPLAITTFIDQNQPLMSIQTAQINFSSMALNLVFNSPPTDLSKYYCAVVYYNRYMINFNLTRNEITLSSPK